jgi:hypothetical protein
MKQMKSKLAKFLDKYVEDYLREEAEMELANLMTRCWNYGINNGGYRSFRKDFDIENVTPETEKELNLK